MESTHPPGGRIARPALAVLVVSVLAAVSVGCASSDGGSGQALPEPKLVDLRTGDDASWNADGKPMVVNLWASWCTPCKTEMPAIQRVADQLGDQVAIVGVTDQKNLDAARKAAENAGVDYPLLADVDQELMSDLGVAGLPSTVFVDADGTVVGRHIGVLTEKKLLQEIEDRYDIAP